MGKHRAHRPWWKPGGDGTGSWAPEAEPLVEAHVKVRPPEPEPDDLVLVRDPILNTVRAIHRRHHREP